MEVDGEKRIEGYVTEKFDSAEFINIPLERDKNIPVKVEDGFLFYIICMVNTRN